MKPCTCESTHEYLLKMKEFWEEDLEEKQVLCSHAKMNIAQIDKDIQKWKERRKEDGHKLKSPT